MTTPATLRAFPQEIVWQSEIGIESFGVRLGLRSNAVGPLEAYRPFLPPGSQPIDPADAERVYSIIQHEAGYDLLEGTNPLACGTDLPTLFGILESDVQIHLGETAPGRIFVHAGVVAWQGRAILVPGASFSGKTTLVSALLQAGATYYSDEFAVLDRDGLIHPYPRLLSLRVPGSPLPKRCAPADFGTQAGAEPLQPGIIVLTEFRQQVRWQPKPLSTGIALLTLLSSTLPIRKRPTESLIALQNTLARARVLHGARGEAEEMVQALLAAA
ncbi:MAG: hypothetical protein AB7K24_25635 [Gemmataceae bacterium]